MRLQRRERIPGRHASERDLAKLAFGIFAQPIRTTCKQFHQRAEISVETVSGV